MRSIMMQRARNNSKRRKRLDDFHLSVVIECGGMRGVVAAGFMQALAELKLLDSLDTLHGSSSGACAAAYFLTEQSEEGRRVYLEDICSRAVVNPFRFYSQPCMVDTDYIVDEVFAKKRRLAVERIISEPGVLNVVTTSVSDGLAVIHKNFQSGDQIFRALKATLRVPGPFEPGIVIDGRRHLDGGIVAPIPLFSAIAAGATHILTICTQRIHDYVVTDKGNFLEGMILRLLYGKPLGQAYMTYHNRRSDIGCPSTVKIETLVRPASGTHCSWFTVEKDLLEKVEKESVEVARAYFRQSHA
jgi:predicted patatin/cPLA2 family phospholipase